MNAFPAHVLVTGGAGGIGAAVAAAALDRGAVVTLIDLDAARIGEVEGALGVSDRTLAIAADVTRADEMERAFLEAEEAFGPVEALVACAGTRAPITTVGEMPEQLWWDTIGANLGGVFIAAREAVRSFGRHGTAGSVVTVSSLLGGPARRGQAAYSSSKAGVNQLTRVLAVELAELGARANSVCPGTVNTPMLSRAVEQDGPSVLADRVDGSRELMRPGIPLGRIAEPEDVAAAVMFLVSADARHITGQTLYIDGGESLI